ncbi:MAG: non-ribosomal peptide synthetase [Candidatus Omnitrophota bacterium]
MEPTLNKEKEYWMTQLSGPLTKVNFPYDRANRFEVRETVADFTFPEELVTKLNRLTNHSDINLFLVLLSGINALLYKYTASPDRISDRIPDMIITIPIFKQERDARFINTVLAIRSQFTGNTPFRDLLLQVKQTVFEANDHLNYPIEKLLYHLNLTESVPGEYPLSDVAVLLQNIHSREYLQALTHHTVFSFRKTETGIEGGLEYHPGFFNAETIARFIRHLIRLLDRVTDRITRTLDDIDLMDEAERQRLLTDLNDTRADYPRDQTIQQLFKEQARRTPCQIAVLETGPHSVQNRCSYNELDRRANRLTERLRQKGVGPGTLVGITVQPAICTVIAILGVLNAGAAYLPIDPENPGQRLAFMLADSRCPILLSPASPEQFPIPFQGEFLNVTQAASSHPESFDPSDGCKSHGTPTDLAYIIYTSGTTGKPKGVLIENRNLVNYVSWFSRHAALTANDRTPLLTSFAFDLGYTAIYPALTNGCELHLLTREIYLYTAGLLDYIRTHGITYIKLTPSLFTLIVNAADFSEASVQSVRLLVLGGEDIQVNDVQKAHRRCPHLRIMNHYGPTESTIGAIAQWIDFDNFEDYAARPTIGTPIQNIRAYIVDKRLMPLPVGIPGELCLAGAGLARGYLNRAELTREKFIANPFHPNQNLYKTGDLARYAPNGHIEILGRSDHQVNMRGFRVELGEIENHLLAHEYIREAVVLPKDGGRGNKYLCAYLVADHPLSNASLREFLLQRIPDYMIPSYFVQIDTIPLTLNGKLDPNALPDPTIRPTDNFFAPRNAIEEQLVAIWSSVLGEDEANASEKARPIGINDNFFDLGGNSLDIIRVGNQLKDVYGKEIPIVTMFRYPTIAALAEHIALAGNGETEAPPPPATDPSQALNKSREVLKRTLIRSKERNQR